MRTRPRPVLALLLSAVLLAACGGAGATGGAAATVNGTEVSRDLVERVVVASMSGPDVPADPDQRTELEGEIQRSVLSTLITVEIVAQLAEEIGVSADEADVDEFEQQEIEAAGGEEDFEESLAAQGLTRDDFRFLASDAVRQQALVQHYGSEVTDEDVRAAFDEQIGGTVNSRHILVGSESEAEDVLDRLGDGEDFAELAQELSTDEGSAARGGELGPASPDQFVPPFAEALQENEPGDVVGPVETDFGFHVIEILDGPEFDEVEGELRAQLEAQAQQPPEYMMAVQQAIAEADVDVAVGLGTWDPDAGQVVDHAQVGEPAPEPEPAPEGVPSEEDLEQMLEGIEDAEDS